MATRSDQGALPLAPIGKRPRIAAKRPRRSSTDPVPTVFWAVMKDNGSRGFSVPVACYPTRSSAVRAASMLSKAANAVFGVAEVPLHD